MTTTFVKLSGIMLLLVLSLSCGDDYEYVPSNLTIWEKISGKYVGVASGTSVVPTENQYKLDLTLISDTIALIESAHLHSVLVPLVVSGENLYGISDSMTVTFSDVTHLLSVKNRSVLKFYFTGQQK